MNYTLFRIAPLCIIALIAQLAGCDSASPNIPDEEESAAMTNDSTPIAELSFKTVESTSEKLVTEIRSARGIGRGSILSPGASWPEQVSVQLHLRGLESLTVEADGVVWEVQVSSSPPHTVTSGYKNSELTAESTEWAVYVMPDKKAVSKIPLPEGQFFEIILPRKLFESNPSEIKLAWVDFYR
jgi:hypothetical protein